MDISVCCSESNNRVDFINSSNNHKYSAFRTMAQEIGRAFINFFYQCYDTDRNQLQNIYVEDASVE